MDGAEAPTDRPFAGVWSGPTVSLSGMPREEESRRAFALGTPTGMVDGIDVTLLDPEDEDGRRVLILADHPDIQQAIAAGKHEVKRGGEVVNPELHLQMHLVVVNQLWDDTPPETWDTAKRLTADGYERHEVLHMLASVVSADVFEALQGQAPDARRTLERLAALPAGWEDRRAGLGEERHANRAERRAAQRRSRH